MVVSENIPSSLTGNIYYPQEENLDHVHCTVREEQPNKSPKLESSGCQTPARYFIVSVSHAHSARKHVTAGQTDGEDAMLFGEFPFLFDSSSRISCQIWERQTDNQTDKQD